MQLKIFAFVLLAIASSCAQEAPAPTEVAPQSTNETATATPPVVEEVAAVEALPPPPPIVYAPKRSFGQWVRDLPQDPILLVGFIVSLLSGVGFLFVIYTVVFELIMGIPFKRQSVFLGGSPINKASSVN